MKKDDPQPQAPGSALNELDAMFYAFDFLGPPPMMRIHFELSGGAVDIGLLRQAYAREAACRPVLNAVIADGAAVSGSRVRWVFREAVDPQGAVRYHDWSCLSAEAAEAKFREMQFDPFLEYNAQADPPFSLALCRLPGQRHMLIAFIHHAVMDAHGCSMILKELFSAYNQLAAGRPLEEVAGTGACTAPVSLLPPSRGGRAVKLLGAVAVVIGRILKNRGRIPVKIIEGKNALTGSMHAVQRALGSQQRARYVAAAKRAGVMLNDFLLAAQIAAIDRWKREQAEPCGLVSLEVHKDLRTEASERQMLANKFSSFFITTQPRHRADLKALLQHVCRENEQAQAQQIAEKLLALLWVLHACPAGEKPAWLLNFVLSNPSMGDSLQVSNLGRLWAGPGNKTTLAFLGDAEITACYMAGPPIASVGCFITYVTYKQKLFLSFNYLEGALSAVRANRFVDLFEEELEKLAGCI